MCTRLRTSLVRSVRGVVSVLCIQEVFPNSSGSTRSLIKMVRFLSIDFALIDWGSKKRQMPLCDTTFDFEFRRPPNAVLHEIPNRTLLFCQSSKWDSEREKGALTSLWSFGQVARWERIYDSRARRAVTVCVRALVPKTAAGLTRARVMTRTPFGKRFFKGSKTEYKQETRTTQQCQ